MRNHSLDFVRGVLIVSVIVGHIILGSIYDQAVRYAIYAVHMPLFIALTGYLLNPDRLRSQSWWQSAQQYWYRVTIPFVPAFAFFTLVLAVHAFQEARLDSAWLISSVVTPYYHLWFIPTLVLWVIIAILCLKIRVPIALLTIVSILPTLAWAGLEWPSTNTVWAILIDKKVFFYLHFFLLGMMFRRYAEVILPLVSGRRLILLVGLVLVCFVWLMQYLGRTPTSDKAIVWLVLNWSLFVVVLTWALSAPNRFSGDNLLVRMGRYSLPIYLWHVAPLFLMKGFDIHQSQPLVYYAISIVGSVLIVALFVSQKPKPDWVARWLYGDAK